MPVMTINGFKRLPDGTITFDNVQTDPDKPQDTEDLIRLLNATAAMPVASGTPASQLTQSGQPWQQTLTSEAIRQYVEEKVATKAWTAKSTTEHQAAFQLLIKVAGDLPVSVVDYSAASSFFQTIQKLPTNMEKSPLFRGKSIQQILAMKPTATLSATTVNKIMDRITALWAWCIRRTLATVNPFTGFQLKQKSLPSSGRSAFTNAEVNALLPGSDQKQPARYWVTLISAYTGMRQNEICQLHIADIRELNEVWVFDVNDRDGKKLKNLYSSRLVPVHDKLIQLGFLDYVKKVKAQKNPRLFPELKEGRDGHGRKISRWFAEHRTSVGIADRGKDFHSFRHTVATQLKNALVLESVAAALLGHATAGITYSTYGKEYFLRTLNEAIQKIGY
jgi:integrase